ncbi:hypothetical protein EDC01DRAFT_630515 [Geopyxis carbonaria]|nr:hypothetical protein EDC01DRAFT_630515 [Geopyxis carbonaria]
MSSSSSPPVLMLDSLAMHEHNTFHQRQSPQRSRPSETTPTRSPPCNSHQISTMQLRQTPAPTPCKASERRGSSMELPALACWPWYLRYVRWPCRNSAPGMSKDTPTDRYSAHVDRYTEWTPEDTRGGATLLQPPCRHSASADFSADIVRVSQLRLCSPEAEEWTAFRLDKVRDKIDGNVHAVDMCKLYSTDRSAGATCSLTARRQQTHDTARPLAAFSEFGASAATASACFDLRRNIYFPPPARTATSPSTIHPDPSANCQRARRRRGVPADENIFLPFPPSSVLPRRHPELGNRGVPASHRKASIGMCLVETPALRSERMILCSEEEGSRTHAAACNIAKKKLKRPTAEELAAVRTCRASGTGSVAGRARP